MLAYDSDSTMECGIKKAKTKADAIVAQCGIKKAKTKADAIVAQVTQAQ